MPKIYAIDGVRPVVDPAAFVHPDATLIGDVIVGPNCYVGPGAVLRGDMGVIRMERGSNMQDNCVAHSFVDMDVVLGEFANVGHGAVLHGCALGKRTLIGMNSVIMDGAVIGDESFVAALCFVGSGFQAPPRTVIAGIPAKVLREVTEEELVWKKLGDEDYQNVIRRSHASLEAVEPLASTEGLPAEGTRLKIEGVPPLFKARGTLL
jgi:phenylacetic acid degradation protein